MISNDETFVKCAAMTQSDSDSGTVRCGALDFHVDVKMSRLSRMMRRALIFFS